MVVLNELQSAASRFGKRPGIEAFVEKPSVVAKDFRFDDQDVWQASGDDIHRVSPAILNKYWP